MNIEPTQIHGVYEIENKQFIDNRGLFVKTFHADIFKQFGFDDDFKESFYSVSKKGVLRGMHFQLPPHDHAKLVYVVEGEILDVALDIRKSSETYGKYHAVNLSSDNAKSLYMAKGMAHGFLTLSDSATVIYLTTSVHAPEHDAGVKWNSFGFDWGIEAPVISQRDDAFRRLDSF